MMRVTATMSGEYADGVALIAVESALKRILVLGFDRKKNTATVLYWEGYSKRYLKTFVPFRLLYLTQDFYREML